MKVIDMHVHSKRKVPNIKTMLSEMEKAGVWGACVFSNEPIESSKEEGSDFEARLSEALAYKEGSDGRIFPILWIHPYEENIIEKVNIAVKAGIMGFKMICTNYYVYEDKCLELLREIARLGKPVFFHSGILWDGLVSSNYNRPLNFEALLDIDGLRFSMGHCSWPWIDECVAMYGKFLNANGKGAEMFFDITAGTPEIYRKELFTKLYYAGYNSGDNIMFGTDCSTNPYRYEWSGFWQKTDGKILDELGVSKENREKLYYKNILRFLGISDESCEKIAPVPDDTHIWTPENPEVKPIIEKWYKKLSFPKVYDAEFYRILSEIKISDAITIETYDMESTDWQRNLLSYLFMCEEAEKRYKALGIPDDVIIDTLADIRVWTDVKTSITGSLGFGQLEWVARSLEPRIFKLGRLQFSFGKSEEDVEKYNVKRGDNIMEIHIRADEPFNIEDCKKSIEMAKEFFRKYFPDYKYEYFTCHSWILDSGLKNYLPEGSNLLNFAALFDVVREDEANDILRYVFRYDVNEINLRYAVASSSFAERVKKAVLSGKKFHLGYGYIKK